MFHTYKIYTIFHVHFEKSIAALWQPNVELNVVQKTVRSIEKPLVMLLLFFNGKKKKKTSEF